MLVNGVTLDGIDQQDRVESFAVAAIEDGLPYPQWSECIARKFRHRGPWIFATNGMENENVAPGVPSFGLAQRRPLCLSMIERLTNSPIPMPPLFVVWKASNNESRLWDDSPTPVSRTVKHTCSSCSDRSVLISNCRGRSWTSTIAS